MTIDTPNRPQALMPLISICLSELRSDVDQLTGSSWHRVPLARARELIGILEDACIRQRLHALAILFRSMRGLVSLPREEALLRLPELRSQLSSLLGSAFHLASEGDRRERA
ncbi:MAG TPA: hypothetical protein VKW04_06795 [Planctomycetota bacterium]|nr:hypothetical protein [Planctomycetota bacterium]